MQTQTQTQTKDPTTQARKRKRLFLLVLCLLVTAVCLAACSFGVEHGPRGEVQRTDKYTFNTERRDIEARMNKDRESFRETLPERYHLAATVDVNPGSEADGITYEIILNDVRIPMMNVLQSFTLDSDMIHTLQAAELFNSNVSNTYETTMGPGKEPLGLSLSRSYVLKPESEINPGDFQNYTDMYVKISYGPEDQRTEEYYRLRARPSPSIIEYMKSWES